MATTSAVPGFGLGLLLLSLVLVGCAARVGARVVPPYRATVGPVIIAHRGGSLEAPENTLAAVKHAAAVGADWVEFDTMMSGDGEVVVFHDDGLERTTNGTGALIDTPLETLRQLDAGSPPASSEWALGKMAEFGVPAVDFGDRFSGEPVPTLDEVLAVPGVRFMIELKKNARALEMVDKVIETVTRLGVVDRVALGSFDPALLARAYDRDPTLPLIGILYDPKMFAEMLELPVAALAVRYDLAEQALAAAPPGVAVWCWTIYSVEMATTVMESGVHGLITDTPRALVGALRPKAAAPEPPAGE